MLNKGLLLACALALLSACDSSTPDKPASPDKPAASAAVEAPAAKREDPAVLAKRYEGRELSVLDVSEVQLDGASTLSISFSAPLDAKQDFAAKVHLVDTVKGKGTLRQPDGIAPAPPRAAAQAGADRRQGPAGRQRQQARQ